MEIDFKDNPDKLRFETTQDGYTAFIAYKLQPGVITVLHTQVPKELEGQGLASTMTRHALENIAARNLELVPLCPYIRAYLKKHPEYQHLIRSHVRL